MTFEEELGHQQCQSKERICYDRMNVSMNQSCVVSKVLAPVYE